MAGRTLESALYANDRTKLPFLGVFVMSIVLFSNNPLIGAMSLPGWDCHHMAGSALEILEAARDRIHGGWKLLHHPLYGNYRPYQQPYRTLVLERGRAAVFVAPSVSGPVASEPGVADSGVPEQSAMPDLMSLHLIEEALEVFRSAPVLTPDEAPEVLRRDCAALDFELMQVPIQQFLAL